MNLYRVTVKRTTRSSPIQVFVVATHPDSAEQLAIWSVKSMGENPLNVAKTIEIIASVNTHVADYMLVIED